MKKNLNKSYRFLQTHTYQFKINISGVLLLRLSDI